MVIIMGKTVKAMGVDRVTTKKPKNKKERFRDILDKYGIPSPRLGGYEYMVATNLMIFEQLKKMSKEEVSMLDF